MPKTNTLPASDLETAEELRQERALEAMAALEHLLEELPPAALLPAGYVRSLVGLTIASVLFAKGIASAGARNAD